MNAFFELLQPYFHFWPYAIAAVAGAVFAVIDRRLIGRYVLAALLVVIAAGGQLTM